MLQVWYVGVGHGSCCEGQGIRKLRQVQTSVATWCSINVINHLVFTLSDLAPFLFSSISEAGTTSTP